MKFSIQFFCGVLLLAGVCLRTNAQALPTTIDVLVAYTPGTVEHYGEDPESRFNHLFAVTNKIFADSQINLQLRLVHSVFVDYTDSNDGETALQDITYATDAAFSNIAALREQYQADMVILYRPYLEIHGSCGVAWIGGEGSDADFSGYHNRDFQYSHIAVNGCGDFVTAHELGHNLGLRHSRLQDGEGGTTSFALGHGEIGEFTTIMAYQSAYDVDYWAGKVYKYSNPALDCLGRPCGIDRNEPMGADAHFVLNLTGPQVAGFYGGSTPAMSHALQQAYEQMQEAEAQYQTALHRVSESSDRLQSLIDDKQQTRAKLGRLKKDVVQQAQDYEGTLQQFKLAVHLVAQSRSRVSQSIAALRSVKDPESEERAEKNLQQVLGNFERFMRAASEIYNQMESRTALLNNGKQSLSNALERLNNLAERWEQQQEVHQYFMAELEAAKRRWTHYDVRFKNLLNASEFAAVTQ